MKIQDYILTGEPSVSFLFYILNDNFLKKKKKKEHLMLLLTWHAAAFRKNAHLLLWGQIMQLPLNLWFSKLLHSETTGGAFTRNDAWVTPSRDSEVIGVEFSFPGHGIFKSSPSDSNVQLRLKITALINRIIMNCLITEKTTRIKSWL